METEAEQAISRWWLKGDHITRLLNEADELLSELVELAPNEVLKELSLKFQNEYDLFSLSINKSIDEANRYLRFAR